MQNHILVLDPNLLICAVLGKKVQELHVAFNEKVNIFTPDKCIEKVRKYLPTLFEKRPLSSDLALTVFSEITQLLRIIDKCVNY